MLNLQQEIHVIDLELILPRSRGHVKKRILIFKATQRGPTDKTFAGFFPSFKKGARIGAKIEFN